MDFIDCFSRACELNGLGEYSGLARRFDTLTSLLLEFNSHTNLTSVRSAEDAVMRHYIDSMTAVRYIPETAKTLADIGCGGGFPTLPVALCRPELRIDAIDSTEKKLVFVKQAADALKLPVRTVCVRAEDAGRDPAFREKYDAAAARAVARLNVLCELCLPLVRVGGLFIAMKGPGGDEEAREAKISAAALGGEIADIVHLALTPPDGGEEMERTVIVIEKLRPTPEIYPRQYAKITKKPL